MPVNYLEHKIYSVDYNSLYCELMERQFLDNMELQSQYLKSWIKLFQQCDEQEVEQYSDKSLTPLYLKENSESPEKYMLEIIFNSGTIGIFFKVSRILQFLNSVKDINNAIQYIPIDEFLKSNTNIKWDLTDSCSRIKNSPIVLVPFTIDRFIKYDVIDGNHRLTAWKNNGRKDIPCIILNGQLLIDLNMFCSSFSKFMYIFQNEIVALGTYTSRDHINSNLLMNKIYFKTKKLLCDV